MKASLAINGRTRFVAVIGHPVAHSASPAMHNAAFDALGMNWRYLALDVDPARLGPALRGLALCGFAGVNCTVPHKLVAFREADRLDNDARAAGAANTLSFRLRRGRPFLHGASTDGYGLLAALREEFGFHPQGRTVAVLGCGGAGRSAAVEFARAGVKRLVLLNRTRAKAVALARHVRVLRPRVECLLEPASCDLLVQATSLGLKADDPCPLDASLLTKADPCCFLEMIYRPAETPAMRRAKRHGSRTANGLSMLLHQGARAFEIWTGRKAPLEVMRRALRREIYGR
ncbi:MAG: shikimate dehydrogenase [Verrucomicrobiae bacterium]|nr:shikimate dehydrogenase [Verrucomicrobiae bacterium]